MRRVVGCLVGTLTGLTSLILWAALLGPNDMPAPSIVWNLAAGLLVAAAIAFRWGLKGQRRESPQPQRNPAMPEGFPELPPLRNVVASIQDSPATGAQPKHGTWEGGGSVLADNIDTRVILRYRDGHEDETERTVNVLRVRGEYSRTGYVPMLMFGFCELRQADRSFMFERVETAFDAGTGEEISDLERYLVGHGEQRVQKIEFNMRTVEEETEFNCIERWLKTHGSRGIRHLLPAPLVIIEARGNGDTIIRFRLSVETIEQYGGEPFAIAGTGKNIEKGARPRALRFTLAGFHTPDHEVAALYPEDEKEPVLSIPLWLDRQGHKSKRGAHH